MDTRARRSAVIGSAVGLGSTAALLAAAGGVSWYYASRIIQPPGERVLGLDPTDRLEVVADDGDTVRLRGPGAARPGWWGLVSDGAYLRVGPPLTTSAAPAAAPSAPPAPSEAVSAGAPPSEAGPSRTDAANAGPDGHSPDVQPADESGPEAAEPVTEAVRPVTLRHGTATPGAEALLDAFAAPEEAPHLAPGLEGVSERLLAGPIGDLPAWHVDAPGQTWALIAHGRTASRAEGLRLAETLHRAGMPCLLVSYRNDPDGPPSPDGRSHLGATEWEDLAAAVEHALAHGARDVVLVGLSMGGALAAELVRRSPLAERVRGLILDAPVLDWGPVIRRAAVARGVPESVLGVLLPPTIALAGRRARLDLEGLRDLHDPEGFDAPTLLIHGDADPVVPVGIADAFAETRSDVVTYLRMPGAGHVRAWNHDREAYEAAVTTFVERIGAARR